MSNSKYQIFKDTRGEFRWRLRAGNGEIVLHSSEGYQTRQGCTNSIESVRVNSPLDSRYLRSTLTNGQYGFLLRAANHLTLGRSEAYTTSFSRDGGIDVVKKIAPTAPVEDLTRTTTSSIYR